MLAFDMCHEEVGRFASFHLLILLPSYKRRREMIERLLSILRAKLELERGDFW